VLTLPTPFGSNSLSFVENVIADFAWSFGCEGVSVSLADFFGGIVVVFLDWKWLFVGYDV